MWLHSNEPLAASAIHDGPDFDVVVLGSGGAGNSAAGLSVWLLEAGSRIGGSIVLSGGVFMAGGTSVQKAAGIEDSVDSLYEFYMTASRRPQRRRPCPGARRLPHGRLGAGLKTSIPIIDIGRMTA